MSNTEIFSFPSQDGRTTIHAMRWIPESGEYKAILQITHGMQEYLERYTPFAQYLTNQGFMVVAHDHIGHGESVVSQKEWGYMAPGDASDILIADMHTLRKMTQESNPGVPYFMLGHSMGSFMLRKYICIHGTGLTGAIVMGTGVIPQGVVRLAKGLTKITAAFHGWHYKSSFIEGLAFGAAYKKYDMTGQDASNSWLTKDTAIVKKYYSDPKCTFKFSVNGYMTMFHALDYINRKENIDKIPKTLPMVLVSGAEDPVGDNGAGVKIAFEGFQQAGIQDVTMRLYQGDHHEILNETDREKVYADLKDWMLARI